MEQATIVRADLEACRRRALSARELTLVYDWVQDLRELGKQDRETLHGLGLDPHPLLEQLQDGSRNARTRIVAWFDYFARVVERGEGHRVYR